MTPKRLRELRELLVYGNSGDHTRAAIALTHAVEFIDAELAKPVEACQWRRGFGEVIDCCSGAHKELPERCPMCGKRVEVA